MERDFFTSSLERVLLATRFKILGDFYIELDHMMEQFDLTIGNRFKNSWAWAMYGNDLLMCRLNMNIFTDVLDKIDSLSIMLLHKLVAKHRKIARKDVFKMIQIDALLIRKLYYGFSPEQIGEEIDAGMYSYLYPAGNNKILHEVIDIIENVKETLTDSEYKTCLEAIARYHS